MGPETILRILHGRFLTVAISLGYSLVHGNAGTLAYTFAGMANGTTTNVSFNGSHFAVTLLADSTNVAQADGGARAAAWAAVIGIDGVGSGNFIKAKEVYVNWDDTVLGLADMDGHVLFALQDPSFANYDLTVAFAGRPLSPQDGTLDFDEPTTLGQVHFSGMSNVLFQTTGADLAGPQIVLDPSSSPILAGNAVTLNALGIGLEPLAYQWQHAGTNLPAATATSLSLDNLQSFNGGNYTLVVTNLFGSATSRVAIITVSPSEPIITLQPLSQTNLVGASIVLSAAARGSEPFGWQWYCNGSPVAGATKAMLSLTNLQTTNVGNYVAVVSNQFGVERSSIALIQLFPATDIALLPPTQGASLGATILLMPTATGPPVVNWQWFFDGMAIPGATSSWLAISNVQASDLGTYYVVGANVYGGNTTSTIAALTYSPVVAWGDNSFGQCAVAADATNVAAMTGGDYHALALRADGTVTAWGANLWGTNYFGQAIVPDGATNAIGVAAGSGHSLALRRDGTVLLWGKILFDITTNVPPEATNLVEVAVGPGAQHVLALRADGTVLDWGANYFGLPNIPVSATNIVEVAAGAFHSLALRGDGKIIAWGEDSQGQFQIPASASNVVAIASGWFHNLALRADGTLIQWGTAYQASGGSVPTDATNIVSFACGGNHSLALRADGKLLAWGNNAEGETHIPNWARNVVAVGATGYSSMALTGGGAPYLFPLLSRSVALSGTTWFRAQAVGAWPLSYQWHFNGVALPGATRALLQIADAQLSQAGEYTLVVSNGLGTVTGAGALLRVLPEADFLPASLKLTNGQFTFQAESAPGLTWWVQGSTNLADWTDLALLTNTTSTMRFQWPAEIPNQLDAEFFRLRLLW